MGIMDRLRDSLSKTRKNLIERVGRVISGQKQITDELLDEIEGILLQTDIGMAMTSLIIQHIRSRAEKDGLRDSTSIIPLLKEEIRGILRSGCPPSPSVSSMDTIRPYVILVVGVNGTGKTTTIGKLAHRYSTQGKKVVLAAADTFRAAAIEQLEIWGERAGADVIHHQMGADPTSVVFDALNASKARGADVLIIDTAGRLQTKVNLMEEVKKMRRVLAKQCEGAPHETLMVLDATTGQNGISQAKLFHQALGLTGIVLTKLDGTARGGIVIAIIDEVHIPVRMVGFGEGIEDLSDFDPNEFVEALFG
jgi:fused signal recognition particle receptor